MSSGLECELIEWEPNRWYYLLQRWDAPAQEWDWREHADCYGSFPSEDAATAHLSANHQNPGGYGITRYEEGHADRHDPVMAERIVEAEARRP